MKQTYTLPLLILAAFLTLSGCTKKYEKIDLSGIHTSAEAPRETMPATTAAPETTAAESRPASQNPSAGVTAKVETFREDGVSIEYPVVSNLGDSKIQEAVNRLLLANATAVKSLASGPAAISVTCDVVSADRSRLTAVYTGTCQAEGAAYPVNLFYTNTVDLKQAKSLGFHDYSDPYTMAGYLMSDDVKFYRAAPELTRALLDYRASSNTEEYTKLFERADFPASSDTGADFPESFSYTHEGVLYFSIPVPHELGDYAIVTFDIEGK